MSPNPREPNGSATLVDEAWIHRDDLMHYARRLLGAQGELAEDVVQEAFLRLHERIASGESVRDARPWLFRVTRNLALDERRRSQRGAAAQSSLEVVASQPKGPLEVLQGRESAREALSELGSLPPREQRTVILDQAGLAPPAIARMMHTNTNAVHQSLFRARRRMRDARAAAWGLLPLPVIRLLLRTASSPVLERLPALAPGSGGRFAGGAGLAGLVAAAVLGGGVVADHTVIPHAGHSRASVDHSPAPAAPPPVAVSHRSQDEVADVSAGTGTPSATTAAPQAGTAGARPAPARTIAASAPAPDPAAVAPVSSPVRTRDTRDDGGSEGDGGSATPVTRRSEGSGERSSSRSRESGGSPDSGTAQTDQASADPVEIPSPDAPEHPSASSGSADASTPTTTQAPPEPHD
jgi:RNA polymerase sigma-70 factor (ECF subfamily)